jgi:hypothetical protein
MQLGGSFAILGTPSCHLRRNFSEPSLITFFGKTKIHKNPCIFTEKKQKNWCFSPETDDLPGKGG